MGFFSSERFRTDSSYIVYGYDAEYLSIIFIQKLEHSLSHATKIHRITKMTL